MKNKKQPHPGPGKGSRPKRRSEDNAYRKSPPTPGEIRQQAPRPDPEKGADKSGGRSKDD